MKRYWLAGLALVLFAILPPCVHAQTTPPSAVQTVTITWTAPTKNTDGTALTGPITYNVYRWATGGAVTKISTLQTGLSFTDSSPPPSPCYLVSAVQSSVAESLPGSACVGPTPGSPGGVTVTINIKFN